MVLWQPKRLSDKINPEEWDDRCRPDFEVSRTKTNRQYPAMASWVRRSKITLQNGRIPVEADSTFPAPDEDPLATV